MSGLGWIKRLLPKSTRNADEIRLARALLRFEGERGRPIASLDDLRLFPTFAKIELGEELFYEMSEELAFELATNSPQDTTRKEGVRVIINPSLQIVRGLALKAWYRIDGQVVACVLTKEDAKILDDLEEAHGPMEISSFVDPSSVMALIERGLLLARR